MIMNTDVLNYQEDFDEIELILSRLLADTRAKALFLWTVNGEEISSHGEQFDSASLLALLANRATLPDDVTTLINGGEVTLLSPDGQEENIHIAIIAKQAILIFLFDQQPSVPMIHLRVRGVRHQLEHILSGIKTKSLQMAQPLFPEVSEQALNLLLGQ